MTLTSFYTRVYHHGLILLEQGLPADFGHIVVWDDHWRHKYVLALGGKYDA